MAQAPLGTVLRHLRHLAGSDRLPDVTDTQLLQCFTTRQEETAFAALLQRHARLVWSVCWQVLGHEQDTEDAFQATFVLLSRKAATLHRRESLAGWLYGTADRLALRLRTANQRRKVREARAAVPPPVDPLAEISVREAQALLDKELAELPERLGAPLVLCYLEGLARDEAAGRLGWSLGTLKRRLEQGSSLLRARLVWRGMTLSAALLAVRLQAAALAVPTNGLVGRTMHTVFSGQPSGQVAALLKGDSASWLAGPALVVVLGALAAGAVLRVMPAAPARPPTESAEKNGSPRRKTKPDKEGQQARQDLHGDPLPADALLRFGATRLRHGHFPSCLAYAPDGKVVASGGRDRVLRFWDPASGKELRHFPIPEGQVCALAFSPDGKRLGSVLRRARSRWKPACSIVISLAWHRRRRSFSFAKRNNRRSAATNASSRIRLLKSIAAESCCKASRVLSSLNTEGVPSS
jgi:RNA polymerase sigma factor (sigma-70 family)